MVGDLYLCESEGIVYSEAITKRSSSLGVFVSGTLADVEVKQFPPETRLHIHRSFPEFMQTVFCLLCVKGMNRRIQSRL